MKSSVVNGCLRLLRAEKEFPDPEFKATVRSAEKEFTKTEFGTALRNFKSLKLCSGTARSVTALKL